MKNILVFGHKNPDTDSVCAAISMAYLKNKLGYKAEPRLLGSINDETKFVLDYLKIKKPKYLNDVKLQIKDKKPLKDIKLATSVSVQLISTDPDLSARKKIVKTSEKESLYLAMDIAEIWLSRALKKDS